MYHAQHLICTKPVDDHNAKNAGNANQHQILFMFYRMRRVPCLGPRKYAGYGILGRAGLFNV